MAEKTDQSKEAREARRKSRERFAVMQKLEAEYMRALRQLTNQIDHIVKAMAPGGWAKDANQLQSVLRQYAKVIEPWAQSIAERMVFRIARLNEAAWTQLGKDIGRELRKEIQTAPTGDFLQLFLREQVHLITSLPLDAADRVHRLTVEGMMGSKRASEVAAEILETGDVTESRARLIARTEIARTASGLTMARAQHVGSTHYVWRTSGDTDVRTSHKEMDGKIVPWVLPPMLSDGTRTHAGMIYNCRCYAEPILTEE
jgi:SPP1 gp7 family putative phage head morphogenesis protein